MKKYITKGRCTKGQVQKYGTHIKKMMEQNNGKITPTDIVEDAKNKESPLHDYFEWDNSEASRKYRLDQAREMLESVMEVVVVNEVETVQRSFFNVKTQNRESVYVTIDTAIKTGSYRTQILSRIINTLKNATTLMELFKQQEK